MNPKRKDFCFIVYQISAGYHDLEIQIFYLLCSYHCTNGMHYQHRVYINAKCSDECKR